MHLPGLRVQAVPKVQGIVVQPGETYDGVWHRDGLQEDIVAVMIYYYRCTGTQGGALEFADRNPSKEIFQSGTSAAVLCDWCLRCSLWAGSMV